MKVNLTFNGDIYTRFGVGQVLSREYIEYLRQDDPEASFALQYVGASKFAPGFNAQFVVPAIKALNDLHDNQIHITAEPEIESARKAAQAIACMECLDSGVVEVGEFDDIREVPCPECQIK